jgi:hypothetical protein
MPCNPSWRCRWINVTQLNERLTRIRHRIAYPAFRDAQKAHDLDERIEEFCTATATQNLPLTGFG